MRSERRERPDVARGSLVQGGTKKKNRFHARASRRVTASWFVCRQEVRLRETKRLGGVTPRREAG